MPRGYFARAIISGIAISSRCVTWDFCGKMPRWTEMRKNGKKERSKRISTVEMVERRSNQNATILCHELLFLKAIVNTFDSLPMSNRQFPIYQPRSKQAKTIDDQFGEEGVENGSVHERNTVKRQFPSTSRVVTVIDWSCCFLSVFAREVMQKSIEILCFQRCLANLAHRTIIFTDTLPINYLSRKRQRDLEVCLTLKGTFG